MKVSRLSYFCGFSIIVAAFWGLQLITAQPAKAQSQEKEQLQLGSSHELLISYQGRLTDQNGNPVADGNHTIVFSLYDEKTGGTALWKETQNLSTSNGVFSAELGAVNPIDLTFDRPLFLGIQVDGGDELTPRTRLTTVPYAQRAHSIDDSTVSAAKLTEQAVTAPKINNGAITSEKFDFAAVDSAAIHPDAIIKNLAPTLGVSKAKDFVGVNIDEPVTGSDAFSVYSDVDFNDTFGGMYVSVAGTESWPFYGYDTGSEGRAWHYFDPAAGEWVLEFDFMSPRHRIMADADGLKPGGDGDLQLGSSNQRWSAVYAANGTIQTSDRRLKTGIQDADYGLKEVLALNPVRYQWKKDMRKSPKESEIHIGLIAQEVEKSIPEVVKQPDTEEGYLGMNYSELVPVLVRAIQQQQQQIQKLQSKLNKNSSDSPQLKALQQQVDRLAEKVRELNKQNAPVTSVSN